jgi:hypothetical protein
VLPFALTRVPLCPSGFCRRDNDPMKTSENLQLHPDPRCRRPHPDALPTHRECPDCPPGANVHPLDAQHFYERRTRFPWNLSRFTSRCCEHHKEMTAAAYAANAAARNAQRSERRRIVRANKRQAAIFYTAEQIAIRTRREAEQRERNERLALYKRRSVRARGGYDPSRDGIKLLIKSRMQDVMRRRLRAGGPKVSPAPLSVPETSKGAGDSSASLLPEERLASIAEAHEQLKKIRALHAAQLAAREVSE